jgi:hypothetical protein
MRAFSLRIGEEHRAWIPFGSMAILMRYMKDLDPDMAVNFNELLMTEQEYRYYFGLEDSQDENDEVLCHLSIPKLQLVVDFWNNTMKAALTAEPAPLLEKYGGEEQFIEDFNSLKSWNPRLVMLVWDKDGFADDYDALVEVYGKSLFQLFSHALQTNTRYAVCGE